MDAGVIHVYTRSKICVNHSTYLRGSVWKSPKLYRMPLQGGRLVDRLIRSLLYHILADGFYEKTMKRLASLSEAITAT